MATDNTLQSIELILPSFSSAGGEDLGRETRCFSGAPYLLRYKLTPEDYLLRGRDDIRVYVDVTEGLELIDSCTIKELQAYSSGIDNRVTPEVVFKNDVTGTVKLKMCVEDLESGNTVSSNVLELNVQPRHGTISDDDIFWDKDNGCGPIVNTDPIVLMVGETFDCTSRISLKKYGRYPNLHKGISRYFYALPVSFLPKEGDWKPKNYTTGTINSATYVGVKTDGTTLVAKETGCGKIDILYLVRTSNGYSTTRENTIQFTVIDNAEALADTMNLRFRIPEIVIDRSYPLFYSSSSNDILQGTNYTWPYENEDGERDKRLQLYDKYGSTNYEDFLEYDDPNGYFDSSRLTIRFENSDGEYLINSDKKDAGVLCAWEEGTINLVAYYGILDSTKRKTKISIPFRVVTEENPDFIPIRDHSVASFYTAHADELDFSQWHKASDIIKIVPRDADINKCNFNVVSEVGDFIYTERISTSGTLDEQYRVRIAGIGRNSTTLFFDYRVAGIKHSVGSSFEIGLPVWDGYRYKADYVPDSRELIPSKTQIKKGEYVFIELKNSPDEEYTLNSTITTYKAIRYSVNSGNYVYSDRLNSSGVAEVICESRRGIVLKGLAPGTIEIVFGGIADGSHNAASATVTIVDEQYSTPTGNLEINASKNTDGTIKSGQTLTLTGGTVAGWNSSSWRYASVKKSGYLQTFTSGTVTIYAVTTDGRLTSATYTTQAVGSSTPVAPEPDVPVDTTLKEAEDITDDIVLEFSNNSDIVFESPESDPISRDINKISHNFDLRDVVGISENPGVATIQASYNISNGDMNAVITPVGKGSTVVKILCGAESDSINVSVLDGTTPATPHLTYKGMTGASLNIYEYTEISYGCDSFDVYENLSVTGNKEGIEIQGQGYMVNEKTARFTVALTDHVSGYVYVTYGSEKLIFSIANRFNLKFENVNNFSLGVGASRDIKLYPLDASVKASEVQVFSKNNNVIISNVTEGGVEPGTGKRFFLVTVTYRRSGNDMLIASRKGDDDIYLDFSCEAKSIPAQSISFNQNSITINK